MAKREAAAPRPLRLRLAPRDPGVVATGTTMQGVARAPVGPRIIRPADLFREWGLDVQTVWRWESEGRFPARRSLGRNSVGWDRAEIEEWWESRPRGIAGAATARQDEAARAAAVAG